MRPHDETPYTPGKTLRETITPVLYELGYGWDDVSGMALAVEGNGFGDWLEGTSLLRTVPQGSIPEVLDTEGDWSWGAAPEGMGAIRNLIEPRKPRRSRRRGLALGPLLFLGRSASMAA